MSWMWCSYKKKAYIHQGYFVACYTKVYQCPRLHFELPAHDKRSGSWKSFDVLCNSTELAKLHQNSYTGWNLRICFLSDKIFYTIQDPYLFPVINEFWQWEQNIVFNDLKGKDLWLPGDGRCDSPRHSAKYGTYTMIDQITDKIVDFQVVQVSEVTSSNAMEREGFARCMENIQDKGAKVKVVATDRHVSIKSDMKWNYPEIDHQYDVWHLAKSVTKKLNEKAMKKDCGDLSPWIKSVSNHLWWCADTSKGEVDINRPPHCQYTSMGQCWSLPRMSSSTYPKRIEKSITSLLECNF